VSLAPRRTGEDFLREDMVRTYKGEYLRTATQQRKGLLGAVNKLFSRFFPGDTDGTRAAVIALGGWLTLDKTLILGQLGGFVSFAAGAAIAATVVLARAVVRHDAKKMMERDIANGDLERRYASEILKPEQLKLQQAISLFEQRGVMPDEDFKQKFGSAAAPVTLSLQPKTPPKRNFWQGLKRLVK